MPKSLIVLGVGALWVVVGAGVGAFSTLGVWVLSKLVGDCSTCGADLEQLISSYKYVTSNLNNL